MAFSIWRGNHSLIDRLQNEPEQFQFLQAVRVLKAMGANGARCPDVGNTTLGPVRYRGNVASKFPASDVDSIDLQAKDSNTPTLSVNFLGLAGAFGPLPQPICELIAIQSQRGDDAARDFLDVFNHRLIDIFFRLHVSAAPTLAGAAPEYSQIGRALFCLLGLGTNGVRTTLSRSRSNRLHDSDRSLLEFAGLLGRRPVSLHALEKLLTHYYRVPTKAIPFLGRWLQLDDDQRTQLGRCGRNRKLGRDVVLGRRVWSDDTAVRLELGPMSIRMMRALLPGGHAHRILRTFLRLVLPETFDVMLRLRLSDDEIPALVLDSRSGSLLGRASWLNSRPSPKSAHVDVFIALDNATSQILPPSVTAGGLPINTRNDGVEG